MKIYLAAPMTGKPDKNRPALSAAAAKLRAEGHEVFNPGELDTEPGIPSGVDSPEARRIIKTELCWICDHAEAIAILPGWEFSIGVWVEWALARFLGLRFIYL